MKALILRLDFAGQPVGWLTREESVLLYCREQVLWEAGSESFMLFGGGNRITGEQSRLRVNSIIGTRSKPGAYQDQRSVPLLTNARLFERDNNLCLYCGVEFSPELLTRDHVHPVSKGGLDIWENVVTACRPCNHAKGNRTLSQLGMKLLAIPYTPNNAEALILSNRKILADQMAFLRLKVGKESRVRGRDGT